jgi:eukaryotic-like serine/threonine-protein kinase
MNDETLFQEALSRSPEERAAFLERACAGRPELRAAAEALLAAREDPGHVLDRPPIDPEQTLDSGPGRADPDATRDHTPGAGDRPPAPNATFDLHPTSASGLVIAGRYALQEKIGEGGMGEVWVARQTEPVKRAVALKLIKAGMDSRAVLQRFEQERQALALMDHPNIARVLDGGLTPTGQPFFAMELVDGLPLTRFCDEARLTPRERLELFVPICQAVQHAHQKGVVHRDLKPANILVTMIDGKRVPKVIDFGVAKATAGKLTDESMATQFGAVVGTLEYMAPEQAGFSGEDIDTRADIYSLGVILYELLTGLRPFDARRLQRAAITEMIRIIREDDPSRPSTRLSTDESLPSLAAVRRTEPRRLIAMLRGELDCVVMKCLAKRRERRYETANGLSRDIQRYLADEPIEARPPSAGYRLGKFLKRHKAPATAAGLVLIALVVGVAGTTYGLVRAEVQRKEAERAQVAEAEQRGRAEAERDKAVAAEATTRAINDFLTHDLLTQPEPSHSAAEDHVTLLDVLDRAAETVGSRFAGQPDVEEALRRTIAEPYHGLASWEKAERQWRSVHEAALRRHGLDGAASLSALGQLAHILRHRGRLDAEVLGMARTAYEGLALALGPDHGDTLDSRNNLAVAYLKADRIAEAIALFEENVKIEEKTLGPLHPGTLADRSNLTAAYIDANRTAEAIALLRATLAQQEAKVGPDLPDTITTRGNLARAYRDAGQFSESRALYETVVRQRKARQGPEHPDTVAAIRALAEVCLSDSRVAQAVPLFEEALRLDRSRLGANDPTTITDLQNLAVAYRATGRLPEAVPMLEQALAAMKSRPEPDRRGLFFATLNLGIMYREAGRRDEAMTLLREALGSAKAQRGPDHPETLVVMHNLAVSYAQAQRLDEAIALFAEVVRLRKAKLLPDHPDTLASVDGLADADLSAGRWAEAESAASEGLEARTRKAPDDWSRFHTMSLLGAALASQKKYAQAEPLLIGGYEGLKAREAKIPARTRSRLSAAAARIAPFYEAWGKPDRAVEWRKELGLPKRKP